jgi:hypothetical protein
VIDANALGVSSARVLLANWCTLSVDAFVLGGAVAVGETADLDAANLSVSFVALLARANLRKNILSLNLKIKLKCLFYSPACVL